MTSQDDVDGVADAAVVGVVGGADVVVVIVVVVATEIKTLNV